MDFLKTVFKELCEKSVDPLVQHYEYFFALRSMHMAMLLFEYQCSGKGSNASERDVEKKVKRTLQSFCQDMKLIHDCGDKAWHFTNAAVTRLKEWNFDPGKRFNAIY